MTQINKEINDKQQSAASISTTAGRRVESVKGSCFKTNTLPRGVFVVAECHLSSFFTTSVSVAVHCDLFSHCYVVKSSRNVILYFQEKKGPITA